MKDTTKMKIRNILMVISFMIAIVTLICAVVLRIKYWEYSSLWVLINKFNESLPTFIGLAVSGTLLVLSSILEK